MKRRGEAVTLIVVILAALGIGAATYCYLQSGKKTSGDMQTSEDKRLEQEVKKVKALEQEINDELSSKFGEFYPQALESFDHVQSEKAKWGDRTVFEARDSRAAFMLNEEFVQKFSSLAKSGSLAIAGDGSRFSIEVNDGESFNEYETLRGLLHQVSGLKAGYPSRYIDQKDLEKYLKGRIQEKSVDAYGYVRLIFKTNVDDVYIVEVFSIDLNEAKHSKGRYIATGRDLLISRTSDEIVKDVKYQMSFDQDFYILGFNLNASNALSSNSTAKECLEGFISQEVFKQFRK